MSILAQRSSSATSRPADSVSTDSPRQVQGGGADDPGRAAPAAPDDHRPSCRADPWSQEPLGRLPSRGQRRASHHPHVRQAVRPHRAGPPEDRPSAHRRRRTQGGQLMRGAVYKRGSTWTWHFDIDPDPLTGRRRQRTKGGYKTKKAAEQALAEAIGQWRTGRLPQRSTHTLSHFLQEEWLPAVKPRLRPSTWANYRTTPPPTWCRSSARSSCKHSPRSNSITSTPTCWSVADARRSAAVRRGWRPRPSATST